MALQKCDLLQHVNNDFNSKSNVTCFYFSKCLQNIIEETKKSGCCEDNILFTQEKDVLSYNIHDNVNNYTMICNEDISLKKYYNLGKYLISKCNENILDRIQCKYFELIIPKSTDNQLKLENLNEDFTVFENIVKQYQENQRDAWFYDYNVLFIKSCLLFLAIFGILILCFIPYYHRKKARYHEVENH